MKQPTLEDHIAMAENLREADRHLSKLTEQCRKHYPKSSQIMRQISRVGAGGYHDGVISQLKCFLDSDYHSVVTDEQFDKLGHIYFHDPASR